MNSKKQNKIQGKTKSDCEKDLDDQLTTERNKYIAFCAGLGSCAFEFGHGPTTCDEEA
jgi:hypothetical protein